MDRVISEYMQARNALSRETGTDEHRYMGVHAYREAQSRTYFSEMYRCICTHECEEEHVRVLTLSMSLSLSGVI